MKNLNIEWNEKIRTLTNEALLADLREALALVRAFLDERRASLDDIIQRKTI